MPSAVRIRKTDMEIQKNVVMSTNSNREKIMPPRKSPRVPPIELRRSDPDQNEKKKRNSFGFRAAC